MKKLLLLFSFLVSIPLFGQITSNSIGHRLDSLNVGVNIGSSFVFGRKGENPSAASTFDYTATLTEKRAFPTAMGPGRFATSDIDNTWTVQYVTSTANTGTGTLRDRITNAVNKTIILFAAGGYFDIDSRIYEENTQGLIIAGQTANDIGGVHVMGNDFTGNRDIYFQDIQNLQVRFMDIRGMWWEYIALGNPGRFPSFTLARCHNAIFDHLTTMWSSYALNFSKIPEDDYINEDGGLFTVQHSFFAENVRGHNTGHVTGIRMDYVRDRFANTTAAQEGAWADWQSQLFYRNLYVGISHRFPNTGGNPGLGVYSDVINNWIFGPRDRLSRIDGGVMSHNHLHNVFQLAAFSGETTWAAADTADDLNKLDDGDFYNLGWTTYAGTPINPIVAHIDGQGNTFLNKDGSIYTGFSDYSDTWEYFDDGTKVTGANMSFSSTYTPSYPVPIETDTVELKSILVENTGASITFNGNGTTTRDDDTENNVYLDWFQNRTEPTFVSTVDDDGGSTDPGRMDAVPTDWAAGGSTRTLATYDSDTDGMPDAWETEHGVTDPWATKTEWTFTYGTNTVHIINNAGYVNLQMFLFDKAGDFDPWYFEHGYYD